MLTETLGRVLSDACASQGELKIRDRDSSSWGRLIYTWHFYDLTYNNFSRFSRQETSQRSLSQKHRLKSIKAIYLGINSKI